MLSARLGDLGTHLDLLEEADYLGFAESGFLHVETPAGEILYFQVVQIFKGTSGVLHGCSRAGACVRPLQRRRGDSQRLRRRTL